MSKDLPSGDSLRAKLQGVRVEHERQEAHRAMRATIARTAASAAPEPKGPTINVTIVHSELTRDLAKRLWVHLGGLRRKMRHVSFVTATPEEEIFSGPNPHVILLMVDPLTIDWPDSIDLRQVKLIPIRAIQTDVTGTTVSRYRGFPFHEWLDQSHPDAEFVNVVRATRQIINALNEES